MWLLAWDSRKPNKLCNWFLNECFISAGTIFLIGVVCRESALSQSSRTFGENFRGFQVECIAPSVGNDQGKWVLQQNQQKIEDRCWSLYSYCTTSRQASIIDPQQEGDQVRDIFLSRKSSAKCCWAAFEYSAKAAAHKANPPPIPYLQSPKGDQLDFLSSVVHKLFQPRKSAHRWHPVVTFTDGCGLKQWFDGFPLELYIFHIAGWLPHITEKALEGKTLSMALVFSNAVIYSALALVLVYQYW